MENYKELTKLTRSLKVLYAEDDETLHKKTISMLKNFFDDIDSCYDGQEAFELYKKNSSYDIVLSDINMPIMDGLKLSEEILKLNKKQKIVIISAYNDSENLEKIIDLDITNFISKPYDMEKFLLTIKKIANELQEIKKQKNNTDYDKYGTKTIHALHKDIKNLKNNSVILIHIKNLNTLQTIYGVEETHSMISNFTKNYIDQFKENKTVYTIGPDKLALFIKKESLLNDTLKQIHQFSKNYEVDIVLGASNEHEKLIITADMALEFALEHGLKERVFSEDIDLTDKYHYQLLFKNILNEAIAKEQVFPVFQPICDKNKNILKYEILMRVSSFDKNNNKIEYFPSQFMETLHTTNLYNDASKIVIKKAFDKMKKSDKKFSINLSYTDIFNHLLTDFIEEQILQNPGIGQRLILEILETDYIKNYDLVNEFISRFKKYGVEIALDDFGSGYSNLNHIVSFQCDYVKLDAQLIKNIQFDNKSLAIVKSIVFFANELGIKTIAEYVANEEIFSIVKSLNVDEFQGFYLSKPLMDIDEK